MIQGLFITNIIMILGFGIGGLIDPAATFAPVGVSLDAGGALIGRGYASIRIAHGILMLLCAYSLHKHLKGSV